MKDKEMTYEEKQNNRKHKKIFLNVLIALFIIALEISFYIGISIILCFLNEFAHFNINNFPKYLFKPTTVFVGTSFIVLSLGYLAYLYLKKHKKNNPSFFRSKQNIYDNAKFMSEKELNMNYGDKNPKNKKGGIPYNEVSKFNINSLIIKSYIYKDNYYFYRASDVHNLVVGTTGTGKTKYLLIPTVMMMAKSQNKPSLVVIDIKGEIVEKTYMTLKDNGYEVHMLDLRNPELSERYNPLNVIINYEEEYLIDKIKNRKSLFARDSEIGKVASLVCPLSSGEDKFWDSAAQSILKAIIYGLLEDYEDGLMTKDQFTFSTISYINTLDAKDFKNFFNRRKGNFQSKAYREAKSNFLSHFDENGEMDKTLASMMTTYATAFNKFIDEACLEITLKSDFDIAKIREEPYGLFLLLPDEDTSRYPLATLIINQIYSTLVHLSQKDGIKGRRDICYILDEFANLPKFENISNWLSVGRERRMFISLFLQSLSQLEDKYGKDYAKTIIQNCNMKVILGLGETDSVDYFKRLFGTYTVINESTSGGYSSKSGSTNESLAKADLVNATEFMQMQPGEIFFLELKKNPGHTHVVPIFDETFTKLLNYESFNSNDREETSEAEDMNKYVYFPDSLNNKKSDDTNASSSGSSGFSPFRQVQDPFKEGTKDNNELDIIKKRLKEYNNEKIENPNEIVQIKKDSTLENKKENQNSNIDAIKDVALSHYLLKNNLTKQMNDEVQGVIQDEEINTLDDNPDVEVGDEIVI